MLHCCISSGGVCFGSGVACKCAGGAHVWVCGLFTLVVCSFVWVCFCLGCVKSLTLPKGTETFLLQVILLFAFHLAFDRLLKLFWSFLFLFLFLFSYVTKCVCCQCTHQGETESLCGSRPMDGRFLVWWVINNVVWTNSWLSVAGVGCGLIGVSAGEEQAWKVYAGGPPGVEQTSRLGSRDPVVHGVKCGPHGGNNSKTKSWTVSWLSLKITSIRDDLRAEPWVEIGGRLHQVRAVSSGSPQNHWVTPLRDKVEDDDSTRRGSHLGRSNHTGGVVWPPRSQHRETSKRCTHDMITRVALVLHKLALDALPSDSVKLKTTKISLEGYVSPLC
jgi:hypothetical protein